MQRMFPDLLAVSQSSTPVTI
uniref:Uncharacterized protein n=1 Tax=Arundo donax TaxID=35708 RepID=A0A0A8YEP1_ARUDO